MKTHKEDNPFRVIVTERETWQIYVARFLQCHLSALEVDYPYQIRNLESVTKELCDLKKENFGGFSIDVKDLFYSIPHSELIAALSICIGCNVM